MDFTCPRALCGGRLFREDKLIFYCSACARPFVINNGKWEEYKVEAASVPYTGNRRTGT